MATTHKTKSSGTTMESLNYQQMLEEVETIVRTVSSGSLDLDDVVTNVERGYKLITQMRERLDATKAKVEKLRHDFEAAKEGDANASAAKPGPSKTSKTSKAAKASEDKHEEMENEDDDDDDAPF